MTIMELLNYMPDSMAWQSQAACRDLHPDLFFPEKGDTSCSRRAKEICHDCDVQEECLNWALASNERFGIWGGLSERERRKARRKATIIPLPNPQRKEPDVKPAAKLEAVSLARTAM